MLVLSQKTGDKLRLGDSITINIIDVKKGKVRLGIEAPADVEIKRDKYLSEKKDTPKSDDAG
jgi:carbon storage regulator